MAELTVAVRVTVSFVTAVSGEATSTVAVASEPGRMSGPRVLRIVVAWATPLSARQPSAVADTSSPAMRGAHPTAKGLRRHFGPTQCLIPRKTAPS